MRRDREGRRGGGVALYIKQEHCPSEWTYPRDNRAYEILWAIANIDCRTVFIGGIYHPPSPNYEKSSILAYIKDSCEFISVHYPDALIILAGDFNQLKDGDVVEASGLYPIVSKPTRGESFLDRIYASFYCFRGSKVVKSAIKTDYLAVIAHCQTSTFPRCS